jgi:hypothetical protein
MIQNDMAFDDETFVKTYFGTEGKAYTWEGEPWNSACITATTLTENEKTQYGLPLGTNSFRPPQMLKFILPSTVNTMYQFFYRNRKRQGYDILYKRVC